MLLRVTIAVVLVGSIYSMSLAAEAQMVPPDTATVAARIDALLAERWRKANVRPAGLSDDAEFLRRAYLDLVGIIPPVGEVRAFLDNQRSDKRAQLIERLLKKPRHATHLANTWRRILLPSGADLRRLGGGAGFESWLRGKFADNTAYDRMVRELLTATGNANQPGPALFFTALRSKPESVAASTSQVFLGVKIACAQCHDHPFDHWSQKDFWSYAAFFARLQQPAGAQQFTFRVSDAKAGEVRLPETNEVAVPVFLGGEQPEVNDTTNRRALLADWLTSRDNPYFARATVNRIWAVLFGYGLVDPVDDFGKHNPASNPQLLDELAADFVNNGFNVRRLFRILANTRAYQLSSKVTAEDTTDPQLFSRMPVKSLTAEQIYDCLVTATCRKETAQNTRRFGFNTSKQAFIAKFEAPTQGATEFQAGIPQALTMMNGSFIASATDVNRSDILVALADSPFMTDKERVETLFLATLSRMPTRIERGRFIKYVETGGPTKDTRKALSDIMWALLNSTEFILNH
ncbi:MAG: DUF1553 domain-containing protein [Planctomycetes bacterium]|nr:DUF1553 domain-containing protein [Planctomycetota bacterium]